MLTDIVSNCLSAGSVTDLLKQATVKPFLKHASLDPNILKKFQTCVKPAFCVKTAGEKKRSLLSCSYTSNTTVCGKFFSRRNKYGTETALLHVFNNHLTSTDSDQILILTLLNLRAAYNTIDHDILLNQLRDVFRIHNTAFAFFESIQSERKQAVSVLSCELEPSSLLYGVPQGSILHPILFILLGDSAKLVC